MQLQALKGEIEQFEPGNRTVAGAQPCNTCCTSMQRMAGSSSQCDKCANAMYICMCVTVMCNAYCTHVCHIRALSGAVVAIVVVAVACNTCISFAVWLLCSLHFCFCYFGRKLNICTCVSVASCMQSVTCVFMAV